MPNTTSSHQFSNADDSPVTPRFDAEPRSGVDPASDPNTFSRLMRLGLDGSNRPIDRVIARLELEDGAAWLFSTFENTVLQVLLNPAAKPSLAELVEAKGFSKGLIAAPRTRDDWLRGVAGYFLSCGLALALHQQHISGKEIDHLRQVLADLATVLPEPLQTVMARVSQDC